MKTLLLAFGILSLSILQVACNRDEKVTTEDQTIQREEEVRRSDLQEGDNVTVPVEREEVEEVEVDRDVLGDDEIELND